MIELDADSILSALDEDQQLAAKALRGPVAIIAGPGSGKTRTVSHRIAYGIATGVFNPQRVLALTYTNRAAAELRIRLRSLGANVQVRTFHSAALSQLQFFWPQITGYSAPKLLTAKQQLLTELAQKAGLTLSRSELSEFASQIEYLSYSQSDEPKGISDPEKFQRLLGLYRSAKLERKLIDWEDVILLCTGMLRNEPRLQAQFEQQYRYFTVDEYQDISPLQQGLLETWLGEREDVCVVGDPRQTIYSFAGADSDFLLGFATRFDQAEVFELNRNYRSGKEIVALSNRVLPDLPMSPVVDLPGRVELLQSNSQTDEANQICQQIARSKAPLREIAVLARTNAQLGIFEQELSDLGVRYQVRGQGRFFAKPAVRQAMLLIRALSAEQDISDLSAKLTELLLSLGWTAGPQPNDVAADLQWYVDVFEELGSPNLEEYLRELDERERSGHEPLQDAVTLATVHGTKGLEWSEVFLIGLNDQLFPISHAKTETELAEERRLFYVAVTRAKQALTLSYLTTKPISPFIAGIVDSRS